MTLSASVFSPRPPSPCSFLLYVLFFFFSDLIVGLISWVSSLDQLIFLPLLCLLFLPWLPLLNRVTPFQQVIIEGHDDIASQIALICASDGCAGNIFTVRNLNMAAYYGLPNTTSIMLQQGVDVNGVSQSGRTALHAAAANGSEAVARILLAVGSDIDAQSADGFTPAHIAASMGHSAVILALAEYGANMHITSKSSFFGLLGGYTPQSLALLNGHSDLAKLIERLGRDSTRDGTRHDDRGDGHDGYRGSGINGDL